MLDARIEELGDRIVKKHKLLKPKAAETPPATADSQPGPLEDQTLVHVALPNQETVTVAGRICLDAVGEGRLNAQSVVLEGSRETSNGSRVRLDLSAVPDFSLFPGQIVACQGTNTTGTVFTPEAIYQGAQFPLKRSSPDEFIEHYYQGEDEGAEVVEVLVAAGPFTTDSTLDFEPLQDLLDVIRKEPPDAVVLIGPFVDENHPLIKSGETEVTFEELFDDLVKQISAVVIDETASTELVLIPALRDVMHDRVFPQPPLTIPVDHERVHAFANPTTFQIKEFSVGTIAEDVLMHLTKQETSRGQSSDRMGRLTNHLIEQHSYYPLVPCNPGINIEYEPRGNADSSDKKAAMEELAMPNVTPDILLLPSELRYFVKNVNGSLVVNPGRLTKHNNGGTFSRIAVHAPRRMDIPDEGRIGHGIPSRAAVQVIRI